MVILSQATPRDVTRPLYREILPVTPLEEQIKA